MLTDLLEIHRLELLRFAAKLLPNAELAEDVLQDTYIRLAQVVVDPADPLAFVRALVRNAALNRVRGQKNFNSSKYVTLDVLEDVECPYSNLESGLNKLQNIKKLHVAVSELPNKSRSLFQALLQDQTLTEYADSKNLNRNSMGPLYNFGLKQLRTSMKAA